MNKATSYALRKALLCDAFYALTPLHQLAVRRQVVAGELTTPEAIRKRIAEIRAQEGE